MSRAIAERLWGGRPGSSHHRRGRATERPAAVVVRPCAERLEGRTLLSAVNGPILFDSGGDIYAINPDGSGQVNLTNSSLFELAAAASPDGATIAFSDTA